MLKVGLVGCGRVSQRYIEVFRDEIKNAAVSAVCDPISAKAERVGRELNARPFSTIASMINEGGVDAAVILSESGYHSKHVNEVLSMGRHVIVEKPAALSSKEVIEDAARAKKKGLMYAPILQNRYNPAMRALKKAMDSGRFGKITLATVRLRWCRFQDYYEDGWHGTWKMDGGVINQQALHHVDALRWIAGPVHKVVASQGQLVNRLEAEDTSVALCEFESGAKGVIEATTAARPIDLEASISIIGDKGLAEIGGIALNKIEKWQFIDSLPEDALTPTQCSQIVPSGYGLSHGPLMQDIVDRLNKGSIEPPITGEDATHAIDLIHAIYHSVEVGGWVSMRDHPQSNRLGR